MTAVATPKTQSLKARLEENERLFKETGSMYGLTELKRKAEDPGRYEAVWHILMNICNTAWDVGCRVSSSAIAVDGGDALWGLHLPTGEAVSISKGITAHPGLLSLFIRSLVELDYETDPGIKHGDIFENNDSHYGGIHASDFDAAIPIIYKGELIAWASGVSHVMDCGAILPGSIGFMNPDAFSDGVPVTMERVGENDRYNRWYEMRISSRTRMPDWVLGDARGRLAGMITIRDKVIELIEKYGVEFFRDVIHEYVEDGRRYAVKRVKSQTVPGRIRKSNFKDLAMQGKRVVLPQQAGDFLLNQPLEMTISSDASVKFSLAGASGWLPFGENITPTALTSALMNAYSHMVGFDMFNWGAVASWELETPPEGSWANPYSANFFAASGVAWAPAVMWMSSMYETFGRLYYTRGYIEEVAAGAATTMTAEFSGVGQFGVFVAGLTLEQASNGAPARGMADGENSAWCIYTPNADFGNAEISESYYPIMYLGRNVEPDSGGYGTYRGGLGHSAVWMFKNTPGMEYQCGCAGIRSKIVGNHGMFGAYPVWPDRAAYAIGTNVKELIDAQKPLVHERGDPSAPQIETNITAETLEADAVAPFVTPQQLHEYDIIIHPISGSQALGDPLMRDPEMVAVDLTKGWTREWVAKDIYGVVARQDAKTKEYGVDEAATAKARDEIRAKRKARAIPFKEWWTKEREKVRAGEGMNSAVTEMFRSSMTLTPSYGEYIRSFWQLPEDFTF
jgi:N-methylhydantoinase B/oxoprolinase/acetone carboxylase alpha subunit